MVLSEREMIRIFIRERKTNTKRSKCIFYMQIRRGESTEMGQKDLEGYAPESLKLIVVRDPAKKFSFSIENRRWSDASSARV
jgi:hypothetical protein